ncbi:hypothetical protein GJ496_011520 [Pomphorhynchus laevis]|nr:hypothetical protein GJ496_011520 [Pomphorhynchus laevis]
MSDHNDNDLSESESFESHIIEDLAEDNQLEQPDQPDEQMQTKDPCESGEDDVSDGEETVNNYQDTPPIVYVIDEIMEKRRIERRRRRKFDPETLSEIDDIACQTVDKMKKYAKEDRCLNENGLPAINKLKYVITVQDNVLKAGALSVMLQNDLLSAIREWLTPLPDKSLPNSKIRTAMIDILEQLNEINVDMLRESRVGRVVMLLAKHPRETRQNQDRLWRLINDWSRSIFDLNDCDDNFSKEERQQRDIERLPSMIKKRKLLVKGNPSLSKMFSKRHSKGLVPDNSTLSAKQVSQMRARVPHPADCDYVYRPTSKLTEHTNHISPIHNQRLDQMRRIAKRCKPGRKQPKSNFRPTGPKVAL